jgi:hypothetical protein
MSNQKPQMVSVIIPCDDHGKHLIQKIKVTFEAVFATHRLSTLEQRAEK